MIIIGAGAAGMFCAWQAGQRGRKVALLDHTRKIGRKILISGGGRCNFTNIHAGPQAYVSNNPHFCKSALSRFTASDFISLVKKHKIAFHEKKMGQLFCDDSAEQIVAMLVGLCKSVGTHFQLDCLVSGIEKNEAGGFIIETNHGRLTCESLVIATGGLSIPQIGATGFGYKIAEQFGLKIVKPRPALDGFVFQNKDLAHYADLTGLSIDTIVSADGAEFRENILFTHTGLSGPASLQASLYWEHGFPLSINLLPETDAFAWFAQKRKQGAKQEYKNLLAEILPKRFAERFCTWYQPKAAPAEISDKDLQEFCEKLHNWQITPLSTVGYKKAEVTRGGVDTNELSSKTMESKKVPGLYFIGEVVDVTGQLGGYNFQWAWSSAFAAGEYV